MNNLAELPFYCLTNLQLLNTIQSVNQKIKEILKNNKFQNYIDEVTHEGHNKKSSCNYYDEDGLLCEINKNQYDLAILHINIRSLDKHWGELIALINSLDNKFDVVALTEIGRKNIPNRATMFDDTFNMVYAQPLINFGGAALLIKKNIEYTEREELKISDVSSESVWIEITKNNEKINIGCIYRHPCSDVNTFTNALDSNLNKLYNENSRCIICGDLNIDALKVNLHGPTTNFMNILMINNFIPHITLPTRITENSVSLIDHILIKTKLKNVEDTKTCGNIYSDISDHLPNFLLLKFDTNSKRTITNNRPFIRLFGKNNLSRFHDVMSKERWIEIYSENDPTIALYAFLNKYNKHFQDCFPLTKLSKKRFKDKKWLTNGLLKCIKRKNRLYKIFLHHPNEINTLTYKKYKNALTKCLRKAEENYYVKLIDDNKKNVRALWQIFGPVINAKKQRQSKPINSLIINGNKINDETSISNEFNKHFVSTADKIVGNLQQTEEYRKYLGDKNTNSMFMMPTSINEIKNIISKLNNNKATGPDNIHVKNIKMIQNIVAPLLCHITNLCFAKGDYPKQLKIAKVIPVHKGNETTNPSNYRPISLLSSLNKIVEKVISTRLVGFLTDQNIIYPYQFGFRTNHSTELSLIETIDSIRENIDQNYYVGGLYIDLSKAFDCVNHSILLHKMKHYGIRGIVNKLFKEYLSNRLQYVQIGQQKSKIMEVKCGVPQGSVLGPILFLLYINDLPNITENQIRLFADDTTLFIKNKNPHDLMQKLQNEFSKLEKWCIDNRLKINKQKTKFSIFCRKNKFIPDTLNSMRLNDINIERSSHVKYLGIVVDEKLNWRQHIEELEKNLVKTVKSFRLIRNYLPNRVKLKIYYAYIHSKIKYGISLYGTAGKTLLNKIQVLQNRAIKTLFNLDHFTPTRYLLQNYNLLSVKDLYKFTVAHFVHQQRTQSLPLVFRDFFQINTTNVGRETRQSNLLRIPKMNTEQAKHSIKYTGTKIWNELTKIAKINFDNTTKHQFKCITKTIFMNRY
jgi:exonuclease III